MKPHTKTHFGDIYKDWPVRPLPDFAFFQEGPGLRKWQFTDTGMKVINVANIMLDGTVDTSNSFRHISLEEFERKYRHFAIEPGDTVVSSSGWSYGKVGRIGVKHLPLMMNTSVIRFHPLSQDTLDANYLHYFLCSDFFHRQIEAYIIGSHQPNFGSSHIKRMNLVIPPMVIQRKIGNLLLAYDQLIENNSRRIAILEEMTKGIYQEWFLNFRFPGHESVKLVDSPFGQIPAGWKPTILGDVISTTRGLSYKGKHLNSNGVPMHNLNSVLEGGGYKYAGIKFYDGPCKPKHVVKAGDLVVANTEQGFDRRLIGFGALIPRSYSSDGIASHHLYIVRPLETTYLTPVFVLHLINSKHFHSRVSGYSNGTTINMLPAEALACPQFPMPPKPLCDAFAEIAERSHIQCELLYRKNENLRRTRTLLLPKLISGQLDVEDLDIDVGITTGALAEATA
jgi:type I restriction enzyme S subunit